MRTPDIKIYRKIQRSLRRILGYVQKTRPVHSDFAMAVPFDYAIENGPNVSTPIAIVCHIYYEELSQEILTLLRNLEVEADIYISTDTAEKKALITNVFRQWSQGKVEIRKVENRGRDIAPKLVDFSDVYKRYELVLFLHSKRSLTAEDGNDWRRFLFHHLTGSREITQSILEIFRRQPKVGAVLAPHWVPVRQLITWDDTFELANSLCRRMHIRIRRNRVIDFPSGSMFWVRSRALQPLLSLDLKTQDFAEENGQVRKTIAHAVERLFLFSCEKAGFDWVRVASPPLHENLKSIVDIRSPDQIDQFVKRYRFELLRQHGNL